MVHEEVKGKIVTDGGGMSIILSECSRPRLLVPSDKGSGPRDFGSLN
jgi:hypothetical protein